MATLVANNSNVQSIETSRDIKLNFKEDSGQEISFTYSCKQANLAKNVYFSARSNFDEQNKAEWDVNLDVDTIFNSIVSQSLLPTHKTANRSEIIGEIAVKIMEYIQIDWNTKDTVKRAYNEKLARSCLDLLCAKENVIFAHYTCNRWSCDKLMKELDACMADLIPRVNPEEMWSIFEYLIFLYTSDNGEAENFKVAVNNSSAFATMLDMVRFLYWSDEKIAEIARKLAAGGRCNPDDYQTRIKQYLRAMKEYNIHHANKAVIGNSTEEENCAQPMDIECENMARFCTIRNAIIERNLVDSDFVNVEGVFRAPTADSYRTLFAVQYKKVTVRAYVTEETGRYKIYFDYVKEWPEDAVITTDINTTNATDSFNTVSIKSCIMDSKKNAASPIQVIGHETKSYPLRDTVILVDNGRREELFLGEITEQYRPTDYIVFNIKLQITTSTYNSS